MPALRHRCGGGALVVLQIGFGEQAEGCAVVRVRPQALGGFAGDLGPVARQRQQFQAQARVRLRGRATAQCFVEHG